MTPWFQHNPKLYERVKDAVDEHLPTLHIVQADGVVYLRGRLRIIAPTSSLVVAHYDIELKLPPNYPHSDPKVYETGGVIPKTEGSHFNRDGSACLFLPEERWRFCPANASIDQFVNGPVRSFFAWQAHLSLTGEVPASGQRRHGNEGILDFYFEELQTNDIAVVLHFLEYLSATKIKASWRCYCGSGEKLRNCHFSKVAFLKARVPRKCAQAFLTVLKEASIRLESSRLHRPSRSPF